MSCCWRLGFCWAAKQETLAVGAARVADGCQLGWRFDALGDQPEPKASGEGDEQLDHGGVPGSGVIGSRCVNKRPIDLDHVNGELV
jgi:hypothetical protein